MTRKYHVRSALNYDTDAASLASGLACPPESDKARQEFRDECDINTILKRFGVTGQLPQVGKLPQFGDFEGVFDFQTAMNAVVDAQASFSTLPSKVRERFNNDPQRFLVFCEDESNRDEAIALGLVSPASPPAPAPAILAPTTTPTPTS